MKTNYNVATREGAETRKKDRQTNKKNKSEKQTTLVRRDRRCERTVVMARMWVIQNVQGVWIWGNGRRGEVSAGDNDLNGEVVELAFSSDLVVSPAGRRL